MPAVGTLMVDTGHGDKVGEFRGVAGPYWSLRPVGGGVEWDADPALVRPANDTERVQARTSYVNRRSRDEAWVRGELG
ncbi:hypothetical protein NX794_26610 [Streptomyces sp. LP11]|uniref:Uncharacterized protein n=1 Tax=Streptomyces pyxinicus TaxID=2970331 RepID=A0ABT2B8C5_9ACTN|nr:hypothetical protein [Streptomyces sp. LP11]MCS0604761.1 hypothetical protein [Streptomyces sp. LP11]